MIRDEVDRKLEMLQKSVRINESTIVQMISYEDKTKKEILERYNEQLSPVKGDEVVQNMLNSLLTTHTDCTEKIQHMTIDLVRDFERIKNDMLISVDVSLRSLEKRLHKYEDHFKSIEMLETRLGSLKSDPLTLKFTDGEELLDKKLLESERFKQLKLAEYVANSNGDNDEHIVRISRSKEYFKYVLSYITDGEVVIGDGSLITMQAAVNELTAYGIGLDTIYQAVKKSLMAYTVEHPEQAHEVICSSLGLSAYARLFTLQCSCLEASEDEKVLAEKILRCSTYSEAESEVKWMVTSRQIQIEKYKQQAIVSFIVSSLPTRSEIFYKVSNTNIVINGASVTNRLHKQFNVAMIPEIVSAYEVRVVAPGKTGIGNAMYIGFSYAPLSNPPADQQWVRAGYYMSIFNGNLYSEKVTPTSSNHVYYNKRITTEDTVVCWYSRASRSVGFIINGKQLGPAFVGITQVDLYPILVMYEADQSFTVDATLSIQ